jgi:hypothetical protein
MDVGIGDDPCPFNRTWLVVLMKGTRELWIHYGSMVCRRRRLRARSVAPVSKTGVCQIAWSFRNWTATGSAELPNGPIKCEAVLGMGLKHRLPAHHPGTFPHGFPILFQLPSIFDASLQSYNNKTKNKLLDHPLATQLQTCDSPNAVLSVLQDLIQQFDQRRTSDERLNNWLNPTVNVLYTFSATLGEGVGLVSLCSAISLQSVL